MTIMPLRTTFGSKHVSWMRKRDLHILTTNIYTYTGDQRFAVVHPPGSDDWDLKVEYAQQRDTGIYECQVNTEPKINLAVVLEVTGLVVKDRFKENNQITISLYGKEKAIKDRKAVAVLGMPILPNNGLFVQQRFRDIAGCNQAPVKSFVTLGSGAMGEDYGRGFELSRTCITKLTEKYQMDNVIIGNAVAKTVKNLIPVRVPVILREWVALTHNKVFGTNSEHTRSNTNNKNNNSNTTTKLLANHHLGLLRSLLH
uniref:Ig-like domain-containing protein n=1 Tax=Glossina pallidipes TaxID=7398 RepID=A0A1B0ACK0_GLOPL